ncbi:hypothetical protein B0H17DRAFT_1145739 [Mycena rosella]|uniref:Uncharacterized protein n=1 Tax=Mycena rosella TaxID=1033263 RepID=A0AAD7CQB6_MYCRO|nr:hypothetical protein B0H17DRAFT_1145739 [Mycena rosella]
MGGSRCKSAKRLSEPSGASSADTGTTRDVPTVPSISSRPPAPVTGSFSIPVVHNPCPGLHLEWDDFWDTYPLKIHNPASKKPPNYDFISFNPPQIRSRRCRGPALSEHGILGFPCSRCADLKLDVDVLRERESRKFDEIRSDDDFNRTLNLEESLGSARRRLGEFTELFQFLGDDSVPALHRVLSNAVEQGWSAKKLLQQCQLAVQGKYTAHNYTQYDIDLAILIYELGGAGTLHAMNHSIFALPSRNTIQPYRRQHNLVPSVANVNFSDISTNISALFGPSLSRGGDGATRWAAFCLEHLDALKTVQVGKDTQTVEAAVAEVRAGRVHISHETSVGAISRLSEIGYGAKPVFMGPSCKKGGWRDCLKTMQMVVEAWRRSPHGERKHGRLMSVSSDGDGKRRAALFIMCMHSEILPGNPLYPFICEIAGLNRRVGKNNLTKDFDPKHLKKRICTSLCSPEGIVVKGICINSDPLLTWLERLPNHDWSETSIHALLNPADAQDVPRAVKLLLCIVELKNLDSEDFDPSEAAEFEALCLLGEALDALLQPFINTDLSLSQQIELLIKFSHLICASYLQNGTAFLSNQLYADLQAMVKNAILMVPKTRLINGQLKVFICLLGDDVLEALFGRSRMIGGHSPNCSVGELRDRLGSAMNLDYIYEHHPEFERKPRRLNFFRMRHVDHLRPQHWKGELRADSCDLKRCWTLAVKDTEEILKKFDLLGQPTYYTRISVTLDNPDQSGMILEWRS